MVNQTLEFELISRKGFYSYSDTKPLVTFAGMISLCRSGVMSRLVIPKNNRKLFLCVSKVKPAHKQWYELSFRGRPKGIRDYMLFHTTYFGSLLYRRGYRYVWFEHEVKK